MKNPGFLTNGTIVVLKPSDDLGNTNTIAVIVGRYENVVEGQPEYVALPVVLNPDEEKTTSVLTANDTMKKYFSVFEDEIISTVGVVKDIDSSEWVITRTINYLIDSKNEKETQAPHVKKLEETIFSAIEEKNFTKFKWVIFNTQLSRYDLEEWIDKIKTSKSFYVDYFEVKEKEIDACLSKLEKLLEEVR